MMKKNMNSFTARIRIFVTIVFLVVFTSTVTAKSIIHIQTLLQEKLLYITLSLVFFFIIHHKICSRVSCAFLQTGEGGEEK
jgi:hypothetical protein